ncbi:hypothetical protein ABZW30_38940 [Kitasatospora sp. NPDC004669]|uniref:hypothetical protein n=1 Tax=Kitasatospora sp. NPDC004669 TaxID=3154555 RepID=UPI0033B58B04
MCAQQRLLVAREGNAALRPCWWCRGSIDGKAGSRLELREKARPDWLECLGCVKARAAKDPLVTGLNSALVERKGQEQDEAGLAETAELRYGMALLAEGGRPAEPARFIKLPADRLERAL